MRDLFENGTAYPWQQPALAEWAIVGMNHYFIGGHRRIYVAMVKGDRCIKREGPDTAEIWLSLALDAGSKVT
jgi:hypothetical protein